MSLSPCQSKMTVEMTNKNFFRYWFHASIFFSFSRVITSHLQTFGSTLVVGKALDKVNMVSVSFHQAHTWCKYRIESVQILSATQYFFSFSCDMLINHIVHIHLPKFKSYHLVLFISTIVTKENFMTPFFIIFF